MLRLCKENNVIFGVNYILRWNILNEYVNSIDKLMILHIKKLNFMEMF